MGRRRVRRHWPRYRNPGIMSVLGGSLLKSRSGILLGKRYRDRTIQKGEEAFARQRNNQREQIPVRCRPSSTRDKGVSSRLDPFEALKLL